MDSMKKIASSVKQILCVAVIGLATLCGKALHKGKTVVCAVEHAVAPASKELKVSGGKLMHFDKWREKAKPVLEVGKELKHCDHLLLKPLEKKLEEKRRNNGFKPVRLPKTGFSKTSIKPVLL